MTDDRRPGQTHRTFVLMAFALSYAGQVIIYLGGGIDAPLFGVIAPILMFTPALAAFVALRMERVPVGRVLKPLGRWRHYGLAVVIPALTALIASAVIQAALQAGPAPVEFLGTTVRIPDESPFFGRGTQNLLLFAGNFLATSTLYAVLAALLAVGEEIGWRGYLQPRWTERFGVFGGIAAVGVAWWLWHVPILLQGYVFPAAPVLGAFALFPVVAIALSFFLGWLRHASGSIWPATLAHGSYNAAFATLVFRMEFGDAALTAYAIIVGLTAATGCMFAMLLRRERP